MLKRNLKLNIPQNSLSNIKQILISGLLKGYVIMSRMSRSIKKHSSGFHEMGMRTLDDDSSEDDEYYERRERNGYSRQDSVPAEATITIEDSDDDNNNEESSPDRHRTADFQNRDSEDTVKGHDSDDSSDDVVLVGEIRPPEEIDGLEELSKVTSNGKKFF
jgi:hypothetical protein